MQKLWVGMVLRFGVILEFISLFNFLTLLIIFISLLHKKKTILNHSMNLMKENYFAKK